VTGDNEPRHGIPARAVLESAVVVVFLLLIWQNYSLRRRSALSAAAAKNVRAFGVHDSIDELPVLDLAGVRTTLRFDGRTIVAIVDPGCDSCRHLLAEIRPDSGVQVLSVASVAQSRTIAEAGGLLAVTHVLSEPLPARIVPQLHVYPQLFVVENRRVVRTCASLTECAAPPVASVLRSHS
jgi:hypothetical protein